MVEAGKFTNGDIPVSARFQFPRDAAEVLFRRDLAVLGAVESEDRGLPPFFFANSISRQFFDLKGTKTGAMDCWLQAGVRAPMWVHFAMHSLKNLLQGGLRRPPIRAFSCESSIMSGSGPFPRSLLGPRRKTELRILPAG